MAAFAQVAKQLCLDLSFGEFLLGRIAAHYCAPHPNAQLQPD
jgi:hypothetical protein